MSASMKFEHKEQSYHIRCASVDQARSIITVVDDNGNVVDFPSFSRIECAHGPAAAKKSYFRSIFIHKGFEYHMFIGEKRICTFTRLGKTVWK